MNRATKRMMRRPDTKQEIKALAGNDKAREQSITEVFAAGLELGVQWHSVGKLHKEQGREMMTFEQFLYHNKLNPLDFAKEGTDPSTQKEMTEYLARHVIRWGSRIMYDFSRRGGFVPSHKLLKGLILRTQRRCYTKLRAA